MLRPILSAALWFLFFPNCSLAGMENARFALHRIPIPAKTGGLCSILTPNAAGIPCGSYSVTAPASGPSFVYLVVGQGGSEGILGVSCGIDYDGRSGTHLGIDPTLVTWTPCGSIGFESDGGFGFWPNPRSGNRMSWLSTNCQAEVIGSYGVHAVAGCLYVYAYSEDVLRLTPNNNLESGPELDVFSCSGELTQLLWLYPPELHQHLVGRVHFGGDGSQGYTPCGVTPVISTSWGKLKDVYRH